MSDYSFDNAWELARQRLAALEGWLDPGTIASLTDRGVGPGWHCLEVGAGGGSITEWFCNRVGLDGRVVATDLDPRFVEAIEAPNLQTLRHDVCRDPLPGNSFDLAHTRLVLAHLPERQLALDRMIASLKPGGWLVAEELDFISVALDPSCGPAAIALMDRAMAAHHTVLKQHGFDMYYGRRLPNELRASGLDEVGTDGRVSIWTGGMPGPTAIRLTFEQLRDELLATGSITNGEIDSTISLMDDEDMSMLSITTVAAWGRRPAA